MPERPQWRGAIDVEMKGLINNGMWNQQPRPVDKLAVGPTILFCKTGQHRKVEKCKCRLVVKDFGRLKGCRSRRYFHRHLQGPASRWW